MPFLRKLLHQLDIICNIFLVWCVHSCLYVEGN